MAKLSEHQLGLLCRCWYQREPSTATIQNTSRSLIAKGLLVRIKQRGSVYLELTVAGAQAVIEREKMKPRAAKLHNAK